MIADTDPAHAAIEAARSLREAVQETRRRAEAFVQAKPMRRVLIVEDDAVYASIIADVLRQEISDADIEILGDYRAARAALADDAPLPGVAIIDCHLAGGYGWTIANDAPRNVAIILMSAAVEPHMLERLADGVHAEWWEKASSIDGLDELAALVRERLG